MKKNMKKSMLKTVRKKGPKKVRKVGKIGENGMRGGRAECLHPAQHPLQHLTLKLLRTLRKGKMPAANKRRVRAEEVRDERVHKRQVPEKWCTEQRLRAEKGAEHP